MRSAVIIMQNTSGCPPASCPGPSTAELCRIIIFSVTFDGDFCPGLDCELKINADVYCCN